MIKLAPLVQEVQQEQLDESLGKVIGTAALAAMSLFPAKIKAQQSKEKAPTTQTVKQATDTIQVEMGSLFGSGKYIIHNQKLLDPIYAEIVSHLAKHPDANLEISIIASESKVPARDGEKAGNPEVDTGFLATERAKTAKKAIQGLLDVAKEKGYFKGTVTFKEPEIKVNQGPAWDPAKGADDSSYTAHQYVKANIKAVATETTDSTKEEYSAAGNAYERVWVGGRNVAQVYATNKTADRSDMGWLNTGYQDVLLRMFDEKKILGGTYINVDGKEVRGLPPFENGSKAMAEKLYTDEAYMIPWDVFNKAGGQKYMSDIDRFKVYKVKVVKAVPNGELTVEFLNSEEARNAQSKKLLGIK